MNLPKVSICIPAYNRPEMLLDATKSALDQSCSDLEVVIVHDGINEAVRDAIVRLRDDRIHYFENPQTLGVPRNWNRCITEARGKFVQILPDDDVLCRKFVERTVEAFETHPGVGFIQTGGLNCDEVLRPVLSFTVPSSAGVRHGAEALEWQLTNHFCMPACLLFNRASLLHLGGWRCDYLDDWATIFKLAYHGGFSYLPEDLCGVRAHSQNYTRRMAKGGRDSIADITNQILDVFGSCLPSDERLLALYMRSLKDIGNRSAKASLKAAAQRRFRDAAMNFRRAWEINPVAYLGPGILQAWTDASRHRRFANLLRSGERLSPHPVFRSEAYD